MEKKYSKNEIYFDHWPDSSQVIAFQIFSTFFSVIFSVHLEYKRMIV